MRRAVPVFLILLLGGAVLYGLIVADAPEPVSESELAGRVARAKPDWANYTEDLKGYLGATPVAQWSGEPAAAAVEGTTVSVRFRLKAPWSEYAFGMPLLLRDPMGRVHEDESYERRDGGGVYTFVMSNLEPGAALPWVEIQFPSGQRKRLVFDANGLWASNDPR